MIKLRSVLFGKTAFLLCVLSMIIITHSWAKDVPLPNVKVYAYHHSQDSFQNPNGSYGGRTLDKVIEFLDQANITYEIEILPLGKIVKKAQSTPNSLIVSLARVAEREGRYDWILPLKTVKLELIGRHIPSMIDLDRSEIKQGDYWAVCDLDTAQCDMLETFGIKQSQIVKVSDMSLLNKANMIIRNRVHFLITDFEVLEKELQIGGIKNHNLAPLLTINNIDSYLAAGAKMDPRVISLLKVLAEEYNK